MQRTHGLCLAWLHEQFSRGEFILDNCPTRMMSADIFTKAIIEKPKWEHARKLIAHYLPTELGIREAKAYPSITPAVLKQGGMLSNSHNRVIIEYCCGPNSKIGQETKVSTINSILHFISTVPNDIPIMLFSAMPCTGGSPWQNINFRKPSGPRLMLKHKRLFQALWTGFEKLTQAVHDRNGHISIEWPRGCKYWTLTKVKTLLHRYDFVNATFDGCMLDLMSIVRTDMRIKKPWRISTTSRSIHSAFDNKLCDQSHEHVPCAGKDTKVTEEYTFKFVKLLHDAWRKHAHQISKRCHTSTYSSASPKIAFMIKKQFPSDQAKAKALELSSCCVCPSAMALSKYSSSSSASKAVNVGETPTESKFSDIRLAFTILEGERKTWIQFCQSLVANAMLVGRTSTTCRTSGQSLQRMQVGLQGLMLVSA
jgi:hypothetical protein